MISIRHLGARVFTARYRSTLGALALFLWLFYYQWAPALVPLAAVPPHHAMMPGFSIDSRFNLAMLEYSFGWLEGRHDLFSPWFYYPLQGVGALSDLHVGSLPFYAVWRFLGLDPFTSIQLWTVLGLAANYVSALIVGRRFGLGDVGASVAAAIFVFAPPASDAANWSQTLWRVAIPPATYWVVALVTRRGAPRLVTALRLVIAVGWLSYAFLCAPYTGVLTLFWSGCLAAGLALMRRRKPAASPLVDPGVPSRSSLVFSCLAIAAAIVIGIRYQAIAADFGLQWEFGAASATPGPWAWLTSSTSVLWGPISRALNAEIRAPDLIMSQGTMFVGISTLALAIYATWAYRVVARWVLPLGLATVIAAVAITASSHVSLYVLLSQLPLFGAVRTPQRLVLQLLFPLALMAGSAMELLWHRRPRRVGVAALGLVILDLTLIFVPGISQAEVFSRSQAIAAEASNGAKGVPNPVLLVLPRSDRDYWDVQIDAMLAAQQLDIPTINGRTSAPLFEAPPKLDCADVSRWLEQLRNQLPRDWPREAPREITVVAVGEHATCNVGVSL